VSAPAVLLVLALVAAPGVGAALAVFPPGRLTLPSGMAVALGFGYALAALAATALALAGHLGPTTFLAGVAVVAAAAWAAAVARHGLRPQLRALAAHTREEPVAIAVGLAALVLFAAVRYHRFSPLLAYDGASAWRYWADGLVIAHAGHVPAHTPGWGAEYPTTVSKLVLNAFDAGLSTRLAPLPAMSALLWVSAVGGFATLWALARELGMRLAAPVLPVLVLAVPSWIPLNREMTHDLDIFTAEDLCRMASAGLLVAGIRAVRDGSRTAAAATGVGLAAVAATHLVPALLAGGLLAVYALAHGATEGSLRRGLTLVATAAGIAAVGWGGVLVASGGELGFQRVGGHGAAQGYPPAFDPARSFQFGRPEYVPKRAARTLYYSASDLIRGYVASATGTTVHRPAGWRFALVAAALAGALALVALPRLGLAPVGAMALALAAVIATATFGFDARYATAVPADFGPHRLYDYDALPAALVAVAALELLARPLAGLRPAASSLVPAAAALFAAVAVWGMRPSQTTATAATAQRLFAALRATVPCDARVLVDERTAGIFATLTGRRSIVEGMAPYLNPPVMHRVLPVLFGARRFFAHPAENAGYLRAQRVGAVVLLTDRDVEMGQSGGRLDRNADFAAVDALPQLHLLVRRRAFRIYAVGAPPRRPPAGACTAAIG
jgi:hypothetical protein